MFYVLYGREDRCASKSKTHRSLKPRLLPPIKPQVGWLQPVHVHVQGERSAAFSIIQIAEATSRFICFDRLVVCQRERGRGRGELLERVIRVCWHDSLARLPPSSCPITTAFTAKFLHRTQPQICTDPVFCSRVLEGRVIPGLSQLSERDPPPGDADLRKVVYGNIDLLRGIRQIGHSTAIANFISLFTNASRVEGFILLVKTIFNSSLAVIFSSQKGWIRPFARRRPSPQVGVKRVFAFAQSLAESRVTLCKSGTMCTCTQPPQKQMIPLWWNAYP